MLSILSRLLGKENGKPKESSERQKEDGLLPQCKRSRENWSWGRNSEFWVNDEEVTEENELELGLPRVGLRSRQCLQSMGLFCFSEFLQNISSVKDF